MLVGVARECQYRFTRRSERLLTSVLSEIAGNSHLEGCEPGELEGGCSDIETSRVLSFAKRRLSRLHELRSLEGIQSEPVFPV